ncbi:MAG TPA: hypothetical protein DEV93_01790 [Chloroflexi bacterium]|nr:hypothetical protein [Chloroflexota bacterium]
MAYGGKMPSDTGLEPGKPREDVTKPPVGHDNSTPFRFYDNRQKYLAFVNTCNEKAVIAARAAKELSRIHPRPPALRIFDAGMGDATVLARLMSSAHRSFPTVPLVAVAKEISLEDVRLGLERMPDRFHEHPHTVLVVTNLSYMDAPQLMPHQAGAVPVNWQTVRLRGQSVYEYVEQIEALGPMLADGWQTKPNPETGNPVVVRPSILVIYREDYEFLLDRVIPRHGSFPGNYDFIMASQPWRARMSAQFKAEKVLAPLTRSLRPGGRLFAVQSYGEDPGLEIVQRIWPAENPFRVRRHDLLSALKAKLGGEAKDFNLAAPPDEAALFQYQMHTLPSEIGDRIGTSTLFAAWNAVIYVNQIEDERLDSVLTTGSYLEATQAVLHKYEGLWFNDEAFVIARRHDELPVQGSK